MTKKPSFRQVVNAKCRECIYDPIAGGGTWREQVGSCANVNCALHPLRPMPSSKRKAA